MPSSAVYGRGFWAIITLVVMAPLLEEFLCRGIILESVRAKYGVVAALFLSSAFFAVLHGHPALAVNAFVMGLILGFIYIETNSIFSVVLLHAMNNGAAFLLIMVGRGHDTFGYRQRYTLYDRLRRCARAFRRIGLYDLPFAGPGEKVG